MLKVRANCPLSAAECLGYTKQSAIWIKRNIEEFCKFTDPTAGWSSSKVHTYIRQVRVVVVELREKLDRINEEIKSLLKMKADLARTLAEMNSEICGNTPKTSVKHPRFIKDKFSDSEPLHYARGIATTKLNSLTLKSVLRQLQQQYKIVKNQLQSLDNARTMLSAQLLERTHTLDLLPYLMAVVAKTKCVKGDKNCGTALNKNEAAKAHQNRHDTNAKTSIPRTQSLLFHSETENKKSNTKRIKSAPMRRHQSEMHICRKAKEELERKRPAPWLSGLPNALTENCREALEVAERVRGMSRRTRSCVKDKVKECFLPEQKYEDPNEQTLYIMRGPCCFRNNPYQAYYRRSNFGKKEI